MINVTKTVQFTGTAPFAYSWISSDPCLTFSSASGTTSSNTLVTILKYEDSACIDTTDVSLRVVDKNGCIALIPVPVDDPCARFILNPIQLEIELDSNGKQRFTYIANVSGGTPAYLYNWIYDVASFSETSDSDPTNGVLILTTIGTPPFNSTHTVQLFVTDTKGCVKDVRKSYTFCTPIAQNYSYQACQRPKTTVLSNRLISVMPCAGSIADWSTIEFNTPSGVTCSVSNFSGNTAFVNIAVDTTTGANSFHEITWTVSSNGIISTVGTIYVTIVLCPTGNLPVQSFNYVFPCNPILPVTSTVDLDNPLFPYVQSNCDIDWSSFTFVPQSGQTLVTPTSLTTPNASVVLNINHEIVYTYTTLGTGTQSIAWKVKDVCGIWSNTAYFFYVLDCIVPPVAVNDTACASCGVPFTIDVLANDTGTYNPTTLTITTAPTQGTAIVVSGKILYTPNTGYAGLDSLSYQVSGFDPNSQSNIATVAITVICAGDSQLAVTCN